MSSLVALLCALFAMNVALWITRNLTRPLSKNRDERRGVKTLVVLGSGGHTSEMFSILRRLPLDVYAPRTYAIARTDSQSANKALSFEREVGGSRARARIEIISRAREVGQGWTSSAATSLVALVDAVSLVWRERPDVVMCNGPGTCVPVVLASMAMRGVGFETPATVFVESACRTRALSLTGKIFYHARCVDATYVMWERLSELYPRATFVGRCV